MLDNYIEQLKDAGKGKAGRKVNKQYAVFLIDAEMFLGKDNYKQWYLTEEPVKYFTWGMLKYFLLPNTSNHPLSSYDYVLVEV